MLQAGPPSSQFGHEVRSVLSTEHPGRCPSPYFCGYRLSRVLFLAG